MGLGSISGWMGTATLAIHEGFQVWLAELICSLGELLLHGLMEQAIQDYT